MLLEDPCRATVSRGRFSITVHTGRRAECCSLVLCAMQMVWSTSPRGSADRVCDTFALTRYTTTCRGPGLIGSLPFSSGSFSHQLANGPSGMSLMFSKLGAEKDRHVGPFLNICALANP